MSAFTGQFSLNRAVKIWLLQSGEQLPADLPDTGTRLMRTGTIAKMLDTAGHEVTWWSGTFNHTTKRQRSPAFTEVKIFDRSRACLLPGRAYIKNISVARIVSYRQVANAFRLHAHRQPPPDVILTAYPSIDLAAAAVEFADRQKIPVLVDIRDLWPDIFLDGLSPVLRPFSGIFLKYYEGLKRRLMSKADAIWGTSDQFVDWGLRAAGRCRRQTDLVFALAYTVENVDPAALGAARIFWSTLLGAPEQGRIFCFFGTFGERVLDIATVINVARIACERGVDYRFVLCGTGPSLHRYKEMAEGLPNIHFPGFVNAATVRALMEISTAGLVPYWPLWDFQMSVPNKAIEYFSAGLPVLASQGGELARLLDENACGIHYQAGDPGALWDALERCARDDFQAPARVAAQLLFARKFNAAVVYQQYVDAMLRMSRSHHEGVI